MSERIHAFGENGELSEGAEKALDAYWLANGGGGGATVHEDLTGRSDPNQHPIGAVTGLTATLANKSDADHQHTVAQISDATTTGRVLMQATSAIAARTSIGAAASNHTHDDRYYTESEVDTALAGKAEKAHDHSISDVQYLQISLNSKAEATHQHDVTDLTTTGTADETTYLRGDGAWATPEGGTLFYPIPPPGGYLGPTYSSSHATSGGPYSGGIVEVVPIRIGAPMIAQGLNLRMGTHEEGVTARVFLFASDAEGHPSTTLASGTFDCSSGAYKGVAFPPVSLAAGLYWGAISTDTGDTVRFYSVQSPAPYMTDSQQYISDPRPPRVNVGEFANPPASVDGFHSFGSSTWAPNVQIRRAN